MAGEVLDGAQTAAVLADQGGRCRIGDPLVGHGLDELPDPEAAGVASSTLGGEGVVGADDLVAVTDVGHGPEEQRAVVDHVREEEVVVVGHHLHVLEGELVREIEHLLVRVADDDPAVVVPRDRRDVGRGQRLELAFDLGHRVESELSAGGEHDRRRGGPVFGLTEEVGRTHLGVDGVVGEQERFGGPGGEVDADPAVELTLGLGHERVARPDQNVDGVDELGAQSEGGDGLDAAENVDLVGAGKMHGGDGLGGDGAVDRRGAGSHARDACHFGGEDAHVCRGHHRVAAAGYVRAHILDRDVFVAEGDPREGLDLGLEHRVKLGLGEVPDLGLGESDVVDRAGVDARHGLLDLFRGEPEPLGLPVVELGRQLAYRGLTALGDVVDDRANPLGEGLVGAVGPFLLRVLEDLSHRSWGFGWGSWSCRCGWCRERRCRLAPRCRRSGLSDRRPGDRG